MAAMNNSHWVQQLPYRVTSMTTRQKTTTMMVNAARRRWICGLPRKKCRSLFLLRQWLTLLSLVRIWAVSSQPVPVEIPTNLTRTPIAQPPPTALPTKTPMPTNTKSPSHQPSSSFKPTASPKPTTSPSDAPSKVPTMLPSHQPSFAPSVSPQPSSGPSNEPSFMPSTSLAPSNAPSISNMPSRSSAPSQVPTPKPTLTVIPLSSAPSSLPSSFPSTPAPTVSPTPMLPEPMTEPFLFMRLSNIPRNASFNETFGWRRLTSEHVRNYWRSFGDDDPFYIGQTVTIFSSEAWDSTTVTNGNETLGTVSIRYSQKIAFLRKNETSDPYPGFKTSDIFTLPFQQNPRTYTLALSTFFNSSNTTEPSTFVFLLDSGLGTNPAVRSKKDNTVIAATVSTVSVVLIIATGYIIYLTNYKDRAGESQAGDGRNADEAAIVGAVIGVNPNENILISESYDEEYVDTDAYSPNKFGPQQKSSDQAGGNGGGDGSGELNKPALPARDENYLGSDDGEPPVGDIMAAPEDGAFPTLSSANISPAEAGMMGEIPYADPMLSSYRSSGHGSIDNDPNASPLGSPPQRRTPQGSGSDEDLDVDEQDESEEPAPPFLGFQMEIQDLE